MLLSSDESDHFELQHLFTCETVIFRGLWFFFTSFKSMLSCQKYVLANRAIVFSTICTASSRFSSVSKSNPLSHVNSPLASSDCVIGFLLTDLPKPLTMRFSTLFNLRSFLLEILLTLSIPSILLKFHGYLTVDAGSGNCHIESPYSYLKGRKVGIAFAPSGDVSQCLSSCKCNPSLIEWYGTSQLVAATGP